jgi:limonene-1,2-epoxide hydrolase
VQPIETVRAFIAAIERNDLDTAAGLLAPNCEYDNVPMGKMFGAEAVVGVLQPMLSKCTEIHWPVHREAADGSVVFNERTDRFMMPQGWVELPVTGVWEVVDGRITLWRDYFDLQTYRQQMAPRS